MAVVRQLIVVLADIRRLVLMAPVSRLLVSKIVPVLTVFVLQLRILVIVLGKLALVQKLAARQHYGALGIQSLVYLGLRREHVLD